ncbi:FmdB family zinc ribbon protein [Pelobacter seleniigenes]|uniref:FmdB family zinc ribbon protein n=1 Tax=Pelobacter seleniigenes TaxID=407188 RepID=UPI00138E2AB0|nr:zinc ribbon domain-containing protein [Pelobacter seleniigenes]
MPIYEYHCRLCNRTFEKIQRLKQPEALCPHCGQPAEKKVSRPVVAAGSCQPLPGSGFT